MNAQIEGDDIPDERPIRVILFGGQFVSTDDAETIGLSATGPDALQTVAMRLFQSGFDPARVLSLYRGGQHIGRTTIGKAEFRMSDEVKGIYIPAKYAHHPLRRHYLKGWAMGYLQELERRRNEWREREAKKASHVDADYRRYGTEARHCAVCSMYRGPNDCTAVRAPISPIAVCKLFELKKQPESRVTQRLRRGV
jgi:hypothetical protein